METGRKQDGAFHLKAPRRANRRRSDSTKSNPSHRTASFSMSVPAFESCSSYSAITAEISALARSARARARADRLSSSVSGDLAMYKGLLSKLAAAKELQEEFLERERRKTAERLAKKEASSEPAA